MFVGYLLCQSSLLLCGQVRVCERSVVVSWELKVEHLVEARSFRMSSKQQHKSHNMLAAIVYLGTHTFIRTAVRWRSYFRSPYSLSNSDNRSAAVLSYILNTYILTTFDTFCATLLKTII